MNREIESKKNRGQTKSFKALVLANRIKANADGWHYDNCKVPIADLEARSLSSVIEAHIELGDAAILRAWAEAVREAHGAVVDRLPKAMREPVGYAVACFKARLGV